MTLTLTKGADVQGLTLLGLDGAKLGTVREVFLDLASGQVAFLIVESGGFLGGAGKFHPTPWASVRYDPIAKVFRAALTKEQLKASPSYDREQLGDSGYGWDEQAAKYFAAASAVISPHSAQE